MTPSQTKIEDLSGDKDLDDGPRKSSAKKSATARNASAKGEQQLRERLTEMFDRISEAFAVREDDELAELFHEDAEIMAAGLVSLTRPFKAVRVIVTTAVAIIEPLLAFGRIARVLAVRWVERRQMRAQEAALAAEANGHGDG